MSQRNPLFGPVSFHPLAPARRRPRAPAAAPKVARTRAFAPVSPRRRGPHGAVPPKTRAARKSSKSASRQRHVVACARSAPRARRHRQSLHDDLGQARKGALPPAPAPHVPRRQRRHRARARPLRGAQRSRRLAAARRNSSTSTISKIRRARRSPTDGVHASSRAARSTICRRSTTTSTAATSTAASTRASPGASARSRAPSDAGATRSRWARTASRIG